MLTGFFVGQIHALQVDVRAHASGLESVAHGGIEHEVAVRGQFIVCGAMLRTGEDAFDARAEVTAMIVKGGARMEGRDARQGIAGHSVPCVDVVGLQFEIEDILRS